MELKDLNGIKEILNHPSVVDEILLHEKVKDRKVVVVSVVGSNRTGKSFFLDYCIRYMYANVSIFA